MIWVALIGVSFCCEADVISFGGVKPPFYLHVMATDGCFYGDGSFMVCPTPDANDLEDLFRHEVFKMLKAERKIGDGLIEKLMNWRQAARPGAPAYHRLQAGKSRSGPGVNVY